MPLRKVRKKGKTFYSQGKGRSKVLLTRKEVLRGRTRAERY